MSAERPLTNGSGAWVQWGLLVGISLLSGMALFAFRMPAALLLGPMIAAVALALRGVHVRIHSMLFHLAQAVVGCLVASTISPQVLDIFIGHWLLFLVVVFLTILASTSIAWFMSFRQVLPGTSALWGMSAGAASAMVVLAEANGADARLVAFMQYFRAAMVAATASLVARFYGVVSGNSRIEWFPALQWPSILAIFFVLSSGVMAGRWLKLPGGPLMVSMVIGTLLNASGTVFIELPESVLAAAFAIIGWRIGLAFTREMLLHAARALPAIVFFTTLLLAICAGIGWSVSSIAGIDPLTAYLATSPGGLDTVAVIASSSRADMSFVMSLQSVRFFSVVAIAPVLIKFIAERFFHKD